MSEKLFLIVKLLSVVFIIDIIYPMHLIKKIIYNNDFLSLISFVYAYTYVYVLYIYILFSFFTNFYFTLRLNFSY